MKEYLGDSVYVDYDGYMLTLTTENGLPGDPSNTIHLELSTYMGLTEYVDRLRQPARDAATNGEKGKP